MHKNQVLPCMRDEKKKGKSLRASAWCLKQGCVIDAFCRFLIDASLRRCYAVLTMSSVSGTPMFRDIFSDPRYFGKHVVVVDDEVFVAKTGDEAVRILERVRKQYPQKKPILSYIPKEEALILFYGDISSL